MDKDTKLKINDLLSNFMNEIIKKRTVTEPFNDEEKEKENPLGYRLVPIEIWKGSKFERSFVTSLGQRIFEQISKIIAEGTGAFAANQYDTQITINTWQSEQIMEILRLQRESKRNPNWNEEVNEILLLTNQKYEDLKVKFDLYIKRIDGAEEYYSIKTVKPNLDQTEIAKRDMLRIKAGSVNCEAYFALPFNPAGENGKYRSVHSIPFKLFNMDQEDCVLIGSKFWNKVGNDNNTYIELLGIFDEVGQIYSKRIRTEYLGM